MDVSTLGERFTVLSISVMYRGCDIPIAWKIIKAQEEGEWRPHWEGLLKALEGVVPGDWKVVVMAGQGHLACGPSFSSCSIMILSSVYHLHT